MRGLDLHRWGPAAVGVAVAAVTLAGCDDGGRGRVACSFIEQADEATLGHVVPGTEVDYRFHPPTSGWHVPWNGEAGVHEEPLGEPEQVGALEVGLVVLQYSDEVDDEAVARLEEVAAERDDVIVTRAAGPIDGDQPVAFTAWGVRQRCTGVDTDAARRFVTNHAGQGPGEAP